MAITVTTGTLPLGIATAFSDNAFSVYIYMEYANNSNNVPTTFNTASNITNFNNPLSYYSNLEDTKNFVRVPAIRNPVIDNSITSSAGQATTTYLAQTSPTTVEVLGGDHVKFGTNSICYGAALVLAPDNADYTKDIILARSYFTASGERLTKTASSELFVTFPLTINSTKAT